MSNKKVGSEDRESEQWDIQTRVMSVKAETKINEGHRQAIAWIKMDETRGMKHKRYHDCLGCNSFSKLY